MAGDQTTISEVSVPYCPVFHSVIEVIGRRWSGAILKVLLNGPRSFGAIREEVPGLSDRLLTERLTELTAAGFIEKRPADRSGIYHLTTMGQDLQPVFDQVEAYAYRWVDTIKAS